MDLLVKRIISILFLISSLSLLNPIDLFAENNVITVYYNKEIGQMNKNIFGNNFLGYERNGHRYHGEECYDYSDYGAGLWDSVIKEPIKEVIDLAKESGMAVARFPGGCGTYHYNWKNAIGKYRKHFLYGLNEFLKTCKDIGVEPIITISYFEGDESDAANLVEYLNTIDDSKHRWSAIRTKNGHKEPYNVKYFEIGNEDWQGDHENIKKVLPNEYANRYLKYYNAIKAIDSSVKIGVILDGRYWNRGVLGVIKDKLDFGIIHIYPSPEVSDYVLEMMNAKDIFSITLGPAVLKGERDLQEALKLLKEKSGKNVPLAITEYNGGFVQEKPVPYRYCLGTALINAELLRIFMKPENNILMANYWNFCNEYWGMVANGFDGEYKGLYKPYYKRSSYYIFELYHKHFGDILLGVDVRCDSYRIGMYNIPYLSVNVSKSKDGKKIFLMVVNKNIYKSISADLKLEGFVSAKKVDAWTLNGPSVDATNEQNHDNIKVAYKTFEINNNPFEFNFEPHSLTAIEITKKEE
ncbi:MAG: alpha-L-arabinofuranosidase C-terminal domain-containing protein [Candidatus Omnitrophota bacterium]|jgi:alpha-N-arabinofuranosidase